MNRESFILLLETISNLEFPVYAISMAFFFRSFLIEKENKSGRRKLTFLVFTVYMAASPLIRLSGFYGWMHILLVMGVLMLFSGFLEMERNFIFLLGTLFYCIRSPSMMIARSLDYFTNEWALRNADTPELIYRNAAGNYLLVQIVQFILFSLLLSLAGRRLRKTAPRLHAAELCCLLLAPAAGILFTRIILRLLVIDNEEQVFRLYDRFPFLTAVVPAVAALFYAGVLAAIASWQKIMALQEESRKYFAAQQQIAALRQRIQEVEQFHDGIRQMKHEMKNHFANIKGLAESGHYQDLEAYISKMDSSMNAFQLSVKTGNAVTDVIVNDSRRTAAALGVSFQCAFSFPASGGYDAYDIGIILSNLLRNALEACERMQKGYRFLRLAGRQKKKFFLIETENSFDGEISFDPNTRLPVSLKKENTARETAALHGIGLSNVRREAQKYGGDVEIQIEGNQFRITVLLQERKHT